jgi:hypothetical protein
LPNLQNFILSELSCCPVQLSAVLPMRKIPYLLNYWSDEVVYVTDENLGELSSFLVFNSGEESHPNSLRIYVSFSTAFYPEL